MRSMENTKLVDSLHMPLKTYEDILLAFKHNAFKWLGNLPERFLNSIHGRLVNSIFHATAGVQFGRSFLT